MNKKRFLALLLSATMILGSSMTTFAAETGATGTGTASGAGTNEGITDTEIYSVTLPTTAANMFDFYLDPDSNIKDTNAERYSGFTPSGATNAYFKTTSSTMTPNSVTCAISNGSYQAIDVTMKVEVKGATNIAIADATTVASATTPTMYMGLVSDLNGAGATTDYVPATAVLEKTFELGDDSADYEKKWVTDKYTFSKISSETHDDDKLEFNLTVGCNGTDKAEWKDAVADTTSVEVTWSYKKHETAPAAPTYTELDAYGNWSSDLWLSVDASNAFAQAPDKVEISDNGGAFADINYNCDASNWVSITWTDISAKLADGSNPYKIRVTVGTNRYTYSSN